MIEACGECGVPLMIGGGLRWEENGVITLAISPANRMVFCESECIDNLFRGIERLVHMPIEHVVVESRRRDTRRYIERIYSADLVEAVELTREGLREEWLPPDSAIMRKMLDLTREISININNIGRIYGYGDISLGEGWEQGGDFPWRTQVVRNPYSILFYAADLLGSVEAVEGSDHVVSYRETEEGVFEVTAHPGKHPVELGKRPRRRKYAFKPGDVAYERCRGCGLPVEIAACEWDLENGVITDSMTGRRMALFSPMSLDAILDDLEAELGETVPRAAVEAQRNYVRSCTDREGLKKDAPSFERMVALRGLGDLVRFDGDRSGLAITIHNSCLHLPVVGTVQAMVEMAYGAEDSHCEWSLAKDGDLSVTVEV